MHGIMLLLVWLAYGTKGLTTRKEMGLSNGFPFIFSLLTVGSFVMMLAIVCGIPGYHDWYEYAIVIGAPLLYIGFVIYARLWAKKYTALLEQERIKQVREEMEEKIRKAIKAKAIADEKAKRKQCVVAACASGELDIKHFAKNAFGAESFVEVLSLWDSCGFPKTEASSYIREEINSLAKMERSHGCSPRDVSNYLNKLLQTQHKIIEQVKEQ